jgi:hypothetical protein
MKVKMTPLEKKLVELLSITPRAAADLTMPKRRLLRPLETAGVLAYDAKTNLWSVT